MSARVWKVGELTRRIKELLETEIDRVWVQGEISGFKVHPSSGHAYFTLKDETAVLACVAWAPTVRAISRRAAPRDGARVRLFGRLTVYEQRGNYQLIVEQLLDMGEGDLQAAFQQLKTRLAAEGLFDAARKRPLPAFPRRIGIVTSPSGAALQDMLRILGQRWPCAQVYLRPAAVQGDGAAEDLAAALEDLNADGRSQVILLGRGGGSLEDLWAFNEEVLARAIAASRIPVISAVGHEVDFTISDFVADVRAATPSNAVEIAVPDQGEMKARLGRTSRLLRAGLERSLERSRIRLERARLSRGLRRPEDLLHQGRLDLDRQADRLRAALTTKVDASRNGRSRLELRLSRLEPSALLARLAHRLEAQGQTLSRLGQVRLLTARGRCEAAGARLIGLGPESTLARGYCILTRVEDGAVVRGPQEAAPGDEVRALLHRGELLCTVKEGRSREPEKEAEL